MLSPLTSSSWQTTPHPQAESRTSNSKPAQPCSSARSKDAKVFSGADAVERAPRWPRRRGRTGTVADCKGDFGFRAGQDIHRPQSRSISRIGLPVSGDSLAFLTASWNFFSSRSEAFFWFSTDWRKMESRRLSCSFMARAASSISLNILGLTAAVCAITALAAESTFSTALQHGQVISKAGGCSAMHRSYRKKAHLARGQSNGENVEHAEHFEA